MRWVQFKLFSAENELVGLEERELRLREGSENHRLSDLRGMDAPAGGRS